MIGKKLKEYRLSLKFTGDTLANLAGIKRSYLSQIENEKKVPPINTFLDLVNAIAHLSLITDNNASDILTEEGYKEFRTLVNPAKVRFKVYTDETYDKYEFDDNRCTLLLFFENVEDSFEITIEKPFDKVTDEDIEDRLRAFYFFDYDYKKGGNIDLIGIKNLRDESSLKNSIYHYEQVRHSLYEWWYNHILKDFRNTIVHDEISKQERELANSILSLENSDGTFTPGNEEGNINLSKELLDGKIVSFELKYFKDKNVRLFLDGKMLSNQELNSLNVSINAIRYERIESDKSIGFDSPEEFEEYRSKLFKKNN